MNVLAAHLSTSGSKNTESKATPFERLIKNTRVLVGGNILSSAFSLIASILAARSLNAESYGTLAGIIAYVTVAEKITTFESWQAIIKYGSETLEKKRADKFADLLKFGYVLDITTALSGAIAAATLFTTFSHFFEWGEEHASLVTLYSITIAFSVRGSPTALLRLKEQYIWFSTTSVCAAGLKLATSLAGYYLEASLAFFVLTFALSDIAGKILLNFAAIHIIRKEKNPSFRAATTRNISHSFPGIWRFVAITNLNATIRMSSREADVLVIGNIAGPSAMGFYKLAKQLASVLVKLSDPLYQSIYPELARMQSAGKNREMIKLSFRASVTAGSVAFICWIAFALHSKNAITLVAGDAFAPAAGVAIWYFLATAIAIATFPLTPFMLAIGKPHISLLIYTAATAVYFASIKPMIGIAGLPGAGISYVLFYLTWSLLTLVALAIIQRQRNPGN